MKGINVRKIAAFAGAAVLGLSAVAVADVVYGNTQLVDQGGQPTVKIYVGAKAQISDGVAAANIAAKIANEAYKSSTLTASVSGTPTCTVGSGVSGAGTCSIVESSKKVTLSVTVPGTVAGAHTFKTLIYDTVDRALANRNNSLSEDNYTTGITTGDTGGTLPSPLRGVEDSQKGNNLYMIGSGQFTGFADKSMVDDQSQGGTYTESQSFWVGTPAYAVAYDSDSAIRDVAVNRYNAMVYDVRFSGNDYGIPVCTADLASNDSTNWASCDTGSNSRTDRHRLKVAFMGSDWIISEMTTPSVPTYNLNSSSQAIKGGQVKLAKESKYGIINVGQTLDAGTFKVRLSDISVAVGSENKHPAIVDILDANDAVVGQIQVDPGTTYTFTQSGTGNSVKIHVYKTAPGFTLNAKWAEMAIYNDEITLKDGQRYNLVSTSDTNKNFKVSLIWKNRDWSSNSDSAVPDSLREIVIYDVDSFSDKVKAGDVYNFLKSTPTFKVSYDGVDLTADDYEPLTYSATSSTQMRIANTVGDTSCAATSSGDSTYTGKFVEIKTPNGLKLGGTGDALTGDYSFDTLRFDPLGRVAGNSTNIINGTQVTNFSYVGANLDFSPVVFWKVSGRDCWNWNNVSYTTQSAPGVIGTYGIKFDTAGDNSAAQGQVYFNNTGFGTFGNVSIMVQEDAGKWQQQSNSKVYLGVPVMVSDNSGYNTFRFRSTDSATQQVYYDSLNAAATFSAYEPTFVSERGSKVLSVGTSDASLKIAKKVGMPSFTFATADTSATAGGATDYTMGVGESKVFGGVTVLVKAIDATSGSCSVLGPSGTPACTVDAASVKAVIQPDNAATVVATQPYALTSSLVYTDAQASGAGAAILVGGPLVNTMTLDALKDSTVDLKKDGPVVKEIANGKIVVAGYTAEDTMAAAEQFIAGVKRQ